MACVIEFTSAGFAFAGKTYIGVPLLVDSKFRFVEPVCDYLRFLVTRSGLKTTSVKTYAEYLRHFWGFLEAQERSFVDVADIDLIGWLNEQEAAGVSAGTRTARCDAVFSFYVWMEEAGFVQHSVRVRGVNDHERFIPRLSCVEGKTSRKGRVSRNGIVSAVRPRDKDGRVQPTPTSNDVTELYVAADNMKNAALMERNHLLIDWYSQVGVRRHEWAALKIEQIPAWNVIDGTRDSGAAYELVLTVTKGGRRRYVGVLPELLEKTREYIEGPRAALVNRFRKKHLGSYREPEEVFLSHKTGRALNLTAITNLLTNWFKLAGVDGHGHRLRATYLTKLCEAEIEAEEARIAAFPGTKRSIDFELVLIKVAERAGHANLESLRAYLTLARKRRARDDGAVDLVTLQQRVEARREELATLEERINKVRDAH